MLDTGYRRIQKKLDVFHQGNEINERSSELLGRTRYNKRRSTEANWTERLPGEKRFPLAEHIIIKIIKQNAT